MDIAPLLSEEPSAASRLRAQLRDLMEIEQAEVKRAPDGAIAFYGRVMGDVEAAFEQMSERFARLGYTAMLSEAEGERQQVLAVKGLIEQRPTRRWVNLLLFAATIVTTMLMGMSPEIDLSDPRWYFSGLPFAASLMAILLAHELAHYFVGRRYGSPVSLPYFIPLPLPPLGTMGAVIFQRAPWRDRKALFDIGIAGPLAGLLVAVPLLIVGLLFTQVGRPSDFIDIQAMDEVTQEGNSLAYLAAKYLVFGQVLPNAEGEDVWLSLPDSPGGPVAFAAWAGLLVTALNLLPIGQLDGGHVAYALLGRRAWKLSYVAIGLLAALGAGLLMTGNMAGGTWLLWAFLGLVFGPRHPPPLNDITPPGPGRRLVGLVLVVIFILVFVPVPLVPVPAR